jgi:hypothetical protein
LSNLPSGLAELVADDEEVARSIMSSSWVAKSTGRIKHNAYMPAPDDDTSVFRCTKMDVSDVRSLISEDRLTEHGAAVVPVYAVRDTSLDVIASEPPKRHANIRGWPRVHDPEEQKSKRKEIAMGIAEIARHLPWKV